MDVDKAGGVRETSGSSFTLFVALSAALICLLIPTACPQPRQDETNTTMDLSLDYAGLREVWLKRTKEAGSSDIMQAMTLDTTSDNSV